MNARRNSSSGDHFAVTAFFVLGVLIAGASTSIYFVVTHDRDVSLLQSQIRELTTSQKKLRDELTATATRSSATLAEQTRLLSVANEKNQELQAKLDEAERRKTALDSPAEIDANTAEGPEIAEGKDPEKPTGEYVAANQDGSTREWHSKNGTSSMAAKLLDCDIDRKIARLLKSDGSVLSVAFDGLSLDDVAYCVSAAQTGDLGITDTDDSTIAGLEAITDTSLQTITVSVNECAVRVLAAYNSDATTIQKNREYALARSTLLNAVKGSRMQIHFLVDDVTNSRFLGRDRRRIALTLTAPDIPLRFSNLNANTGQTIDVLTSAELAESINKGDVVRVIGRINEPSRKTFAALKFVYDLPDVPRNFAYNAGNTFYTAGASPGESSAQVALGFYIDHMRKLNPDETNAYLDAQKSREVTE